MILRISLLLWALSFGHFLPAQETLHTTNGPVKVAYYTYGKGTPVLLINGGPGYSSDHLREVAMELSTSAQIILFDQRGTGRSMLSEMSEETVNLQQTLLDIENIRKHLKLESWVVAGQSFGGLLAMAYAASFGERVQKLLLISSAGPDLRFIPSFRDNILNIIGRDTIRYAMPDNTPDEEFFLNMVNVNAPAYLYDKSKADLIRKTLVDKDAFVFEINSLMLRDLFKNKFDVKEKLKAFQKPVLIIQGAQDIVGMDTAFRTHQLLSGSELYFIPKCGHIPWVEQPEIFFDKVKSFIVAK